jgi:hypothetical protein
MSAAANQANSPHPAVATATVAIVGDWEAYDLEDWNRKWLCPPVASRWQ